MKIFLPFVTSGSERPEIFEEAQPADLRIVRGRIECDSRGFAALLPTSLKSAEDALPAGFDFAARNAAGELLSLCRSAGLTMATAESCTGGGIAADLTSHAGSSDVFLGAIVSYSNDIKADLLGVGENVLAAHGAVSPQSAGAMAIGALKRINAGLAISVTGIAGPGGGSADKPVGLVYTAVALAAESRPDVRRWLFDGDREGNPGLEQDCRAAARHLEDIEWLTAQGSAYYI
jgi:nicotinamide-nucleotide amidase